MRKGLQMKTAETIRHLLQDRSITKISRATSLSRPTIIAVRDNPEGSPAYDTIKKLSDYFEAQEQEANAAGTQG